MHTIQNNPGEKRLAHLAVPTITVLIAAICFWSPNPGFLDFAGGATSRVRAKSPKLVLTTKPIEKVRIGDRVAARNPEVTDIERNSWPKNDWTLHKEVSLELPKPDTGGAVHIKLLRSAKWVKLHDATVGSSIVLSLPELGVHGHATIKQINNAKEVRAGPGQVVTGQFEHSSTSDILDLHFSGDTDTIGATSNHPFWSTDRDAFVEAGNLKIGEHVRTLHGDIKSLKTKKLRNQPELVYNLEVDNEHVYYVGESGILVHNNKSGPKVKCLAPETRILLEGGSTKQICDITFGDRVLSADPKKPFSLQSQAITGLIESRSEHFYHIEVGGDDSSSTGTIRATGRHPFWTEQRGWSLARDLKRGDRLLDATGKRCDVRSVTFTVATSPSFNLDISGLSSYFVVINGNAVLTHNSDIFFVDPNDVFFSQKRYSATMRGGRTVERLIDALRTKGGGILNHDPVKLVELEHLPDHVQQKLRAQGAKPGDVFTLDNRRVFSGQQANTRIPARWATEEEIRADTRPDGRKGSPKNNPYGKFTTESAGRSICLN